MPDQGLVPMHEGTLERLRAYGLFVGLEVEIGDRVYIFVGELKGRSVRVNWGSDEDNAKHELFTLALPDDKGNVQLKVAAVRRGYWAPLGYRPAIHGSRTLGSR